jgi:ubiquinone/menaquinone biosynthesis C-methylase UbiE
MKIPRAQEPEDAAAHTARLDRAYTRQARLYDLAVKRLPLWRRWIGSALPHVVGPRVLEVSFGTGYLLTQLAARYETWGIDLNARMVAVAHQNVQDSANIFLARADVYALPFAAASFNALVNTMAFSGYPRAEPALGEMVRVLRPGGRLVFVDVGYPRNGNMLGTLLARFWSAAGDIVRNMPTLLQNAGLDVTAKEVGGWGSVHLYVARKGAG